MEKLKEILRSLKLKNDKNKALEKIIIVLVIGVVFMIVGDLGNDKEENIDKQCIEKEPQNTPIYQDIEEKMECILSKIEGAGKVKVMVTYKTSKEIIHQIEQKESTNNTKEEDGGGGVRETRQHETAKSIIFEEANGQKKAIIKKEIEPLIKGVVVVAEGAADANVKMNLQMATKILTDIPIHKISVFVMEK